MRRLGLGLVIAFVAAQVIPISRTNPPATSEIAVPIEIDGLLQRACCDCHSNETRWPWYAYVAPASWLVAWDVREARKHLNFSTWGDYAPKKQRNKLKELVEMIDEDEMPLWYYRPLHRDAQLTQAERHQLIAWARAERAAAAPPKPAGDPEPTLPNVAYGADRHQVLDFWKAESKAPTPLMFYIHGGSWEAGSKDYVAGLRQVLDAGISVVSIEYRMLSKAVLAGVKPPIQFPLHDAARALQFVRSKAAEWNIDKTRIGVAGNSAGACSGLWLAFHDDMADPKSADPVARESTRLSLAALISAQTSLDPKQMKEWIPNIDYGAHAFGFTPDPERGVKKFQKFLEARDTIQPWIKEYSPYALATADDPPVYITYITPPAMGQPETESTHSANFGVGLQQKLRGVGVECQIDYPGAPGVEFRQAHEFLIARLNALPEGRPAQEPPP